MITSNVILITGFVLLITVGKYMAFLAVVYCHLQFLRPAFKEDLAHLFSLLIQVVAVPMGNTQIRQLATNRFAWVKVCKNGVEHWRAAAASQVVTHKC